MVPITNATPAATKTQKVDIVGCVGGLAERIESRCSAGPALAGSASAVLTPRGGVSAASEHVS